MTTLRETNVRPVLQPGEWCRSGAEIFAACPLCGQMASLAGHTVLFDGTVQPSMACARQGCGFDDHVRLLNRLPS